jgi:hypothetical protein
VGVIAFAVPQGYLIGLGVGLALDRLPVRYGRERESTVAE